MDGFVTRMFPQTMSEDMLYWFKIRLRFAPNMLELHGDDVTSLGEDAMTTSARRGEKTVDRSSSPDSIQIFLGRFFVDTKKNGRAPVRRFVAADLYEDRANV